MSTHHHIFLRAIIVSVCLLGRDAAHGDDDAATKGKPNAAKVEPKPADDSSSLPPGKADVKQDPKSAKYAEGYESGFVAGESAHNAGETNRSHPPFLDIITDADRAERDAAEQDGANNYQLGLRKGYMDGFAGLARGGVPQAPLPKLPIVEKVSRAAASRSLGAIKNVTD